jgi:branched-chain amino acid transport system substrate-binding protein
VYGRQITYDWRDDQGNADANGTAVQSLVNNSHVFGLFEESPVASGGAQFLADNDVPVVGLASELALWLKYPNLVSALNSSGSLGVWAQVFKEQHVTKLAILTEALSPVDAQIAGLIVTSANTVGINTEVLKVPTTEDPAVTAQRIAATGANGLTGILGNLATYNEIGHLAQTGPHPVRVVLSSSGYDQNLLHTSGAQMANFYLPLNFLPFEAGGAAMARYLNAMTVYAPQVADPRQEFALRAYIDADLFLRGLQLAGPCPTRAGFLNAVHSLSSYDADGLAQPVNLSPGFPQPTCLALVRVNPAGNAFDVVSRRVCGPVPHA